MSFTHRNLVPASRTESTFAPTTLRQHFPRLPLDPQHPGNQQLSDPFPMRDLLWRRIKIDERNTQLAAIIGVDRARGIDDADPALERQTRAGTNLRFHVIGQRNRETRRDQLPPHRGNDDGLAGIPQIDRSREFGAVSGQVPVGRKILQPLYQHGHRIHSAPTPLRPYRTFSTGVYVRSNASATASYTILPFTMFSPSASARSSLHADFQPLFASLRAYGSVAFVSANVEVRGTPPGIFATA